MTRYTYKPNRFLRPHRDKRTVLDKMKANWRALVVAGASLSVGMNQSFQQQLLKEISNARE